METVTIKMIRFYLIVYNWNEWRAPQSFIVIAYVPNEIAFYLIDNKIAQSNLW